MDHWAAVRSVEGLAAVRCGRNGSAADVVVGQVGDAAQSRSRTARECRSPERGHPGGSRRRRDSNRRCPDGCGGRSHDWVCAAQPGPNQGRACSVPGGRRRSPEVRWVDRAVGAVPAGPGQACGPARCVRWCRPAENRHPTGCRSTTTACERRPSRELVWRVAAVRNPAVAQHDPASAEKWGRKASEPGAVRSDRRGALRGRQREPVDDRPSQVASASPMWAPRRPRCRRCGLRGQLAPHDPGRSRRRGWSHPDRSSPGSPSSTAAPTSSRRRAAS